MLSRWIDEAWTWTYREAMQIIPMSLQLKFLPHIPIKKLPHNPAVNIAVCYSFLLTESVEQTRNCPPCHPQRPYSSPS